ncbi:MAG TPA: DUF5655 domain-containing protein [Bryobacteraceae bacterium]|jgi:hypothetical protein|nr:DUF5655 domain-containing protein [Bryobacteraceae bacterium]
MPAEIKPNPFEKSSPETKALYERLLTALRKLGPFEAEWKKTSIHLVRKTAFAGVHPRKASLVLTLKASELIKSPRIAKSEQVSRNRWHLDLKVNSPSEIDKQLLDWLRAAYDLAA